MLGPYSIAGAISLGLFIRFGMKVGVAQLLSFVMQHQARTLENLLGSSTSAAMQISFRIGFLQVRDGRRSAMKAPQPQAGGFSAFMFINIATMRALKGCVKDTRSLALAPPNQQPFPPPAVTSIAVTAGRGYGPRGKDLKPTH